MFSVAEELLADSDLQALRTVALTVRAWCLKLGEAASAVLVAASSSASVATDTPTQSCIESRANIFESKKEEKRKKRKRREWEWNGERLWIEKRGSAIDARRKGESEEREDGCEEGVRVSWKTLYRCLLYASGLEHSNLSAGSHTNKRISVALAAER